jgi:hypothetical protein
MMPGLRPHRSETMPHRLLPAKTMMLPQNSGVATISGVQFSSFCRYVENNAQIE